MHNKLLIQRNLYPCQVGHLGEEYQEWIHQPIVCVEGPRFFESDFWEVT
jgi:hypothetical protein